MSTLREAPRLRRSLPLRRKPSRRIFWRRARVRRARANVEHLLRAFDARARGARERDGLLPFLFVVALVIGALRAGLIRR